MASYNSTWIWTMFGLKWRNATILEILRMALPNVVVWFCCLHVYTAVYRLGSRHSSEKLKCTLIQSLHAILHPLNDAVPFV